MLWWTKRYRFNFSCDLLSDESTRQSRHALGSHELRWLYPGHRLSPSCWQCHSQFLQADVRLPRVWTSKAAFKYHQAHLTGHQDCRHMEPWQQKLSDPASLLSLPQTVSTAIPSSKPLYNKNENIAVVESNTNNTSFYSDNPFHINRTDSSVDW